MGGIVAPSTTIGGTVLAPGIPLLGAPLTGLYELPGLNGAGFAVNALNYWTLTALGMTLGNVPPTIFTLQPVVGSPFATGLNPYPIAISPNSMFVFIPNFGANTVGAYTLNSVTGQLSQVVGSPFPTGLGPSSVAVSPDGVHLIVVNNAGPTLSVFSINPITGFLTAVVGSPFAAGLGPTGVTFTPDGLHVLVTDNPNNNLLVYSRNVGSGFLTPIAGSPFAVGAGPEFTTVSPDGLHVYVSNSTANTLSGFSRNSATGFLTPLAGFPVATAVQPIGISMSPDGLHVAVACNAAFVVSVYARNSATGALTPVAGSPFATGNNPYGVTFSPDGAHVYVGNSGSNSISVYLRNSATGLLTPIAGSPFAAGAVPTSPTPASDGRHVITPNRAGNTATVYQTGTTSTFPLVNCTFDPIGGLNGVFGINGSLIVNGQPVAVLPPITGNIGKYLRADTSGVIVYDGVNTYIPLALVANAAAANIDDSGDYVIELTGAQTATSLLTLTFTNPTNASKVIIDNKTTGNFLTTVATIPAGAGLIYASPGRSIWYWSGQAGATLEQIENLAAQVIAKSAVGVTSPADVTEDILATINLPPLLPNDQLRIYSLFSFNNNANVKTVKVYLGGLGGALFENFNAANNSSANVVTEIANRNNVALQVGPPVLGYGLSALAVNTGAVNTGIPQTIVITGQKAVAGDTITLESYMVEIISNGT